MADLARPVPVVGNRVLLLIYVAVFGGYTGMQVLTPILPPLARELRLTEFQLGLVTSAAAVTVAVVSPLWGRRSDQWVRKPVFRDGRRRRNRPGSARSTIGCGRSC